MSENSYAGLKKLFAPIDMTTGVPGKQIVAFAVPMLIGNIAQQLYNTVDSIIVGRYVGDNALAAVGSAGPILNLLLVLFVGISVGAGIMVSQYFGAKEREDLSGTIGSCVTLTAISSLFIMVAGPMVSRPLLELLGTPDSILGWCESYLNIIFIGIAGLAYYNILGGVLRGLGDSVSALVYLLVSTVINIVLDILFVANFNMGVAGVALATAIAQAISAVLCLVKLMRMSDVFDFKKKYLKLHRKYSWMTIRLGLPSGLTQAVFSMAMIIVQSLTNSFGELFIAANVIVMRVCRTKCGGKRIRESGTGSEAGNLDCHGSVCIHYGFNPDFRKIPDGDFYGNGRIGGYEYAYDAHSCGRVYCDGGYPVVVRRDARGGGYHDPDVDFAGNDRGNPCAGGVWDCVSYKK